MKNKKVLITGGAGFLGSNLARRLAGEGAEVSIFVFPEENLENIKDIENKIEVIRGDLTDESDVEQAVKDKDYLFHFAWQTDLKKSMENPKKDIQDDVVGVVNILETSRKKNPKIKIIFASSVTVIGESEELSPKEEHREDPLSVYEINKLTAEKYILMYSKIYNLKACVLRLSNVFGEYQKIDNPNRGVLNFMIGRALRGEKLTVYGDGSFVRDYCYVQNYIDAFILAALSDKTNGEVFILGSGKGISFKEAMIKIKETTEEITGKNVEIEYVAFPEGEHKINKRNFISNYGKFRETTGWSPKISFEEGLRRTIKFYC